MGKSSLEKIILAEKLLRQGKPYRYIQAKLQNEFGSGMSNTTLKNLQKQQLKIKILENRVSELEHELNLFKKMYFELKAAVQRKISDIESRKMNVEVNINVKERRCKMCNSELPDNAKYCPYCGEFN